MIGFIGGTGSEGRGLALRFALAGKKVLIGSRDETRARETAAGVKSLAPQSTVYGSDNDDVARRAHIVFFTVPYAAHLQTLEATRDQLIGKIVVDVVAPVALSNGKARVEAVAEGSAALQAQAVLPRSAVVAAFQTISAQDLLVPNKSIDADVVVCADDPDAKDVVMQLAESIRSIRAVNGGGLQNAGYVENLTALLMNINRLYGGRSGIKIVGI